MKKFFLLFLFVAIGLALCAPVQAADYPKVPILMVHGLGGSPANFNTIISRLKDNGYDSSMLFTVSISPNYTMCSTNHMALIDATVNQIITQTGFDEIDVIGHSRGGLNLYDYVRFGDGAVHVRNWVSIGGANNWPCSFNSSPPADDTPGGALYTSIYSTSDRLVNPTMASIEDANNVAVSGVGHIAMITSSTVFQLILDALQGTGLNDNQGIPDPPSPPDETVFNVVVDGITWELPIELLSDLTTWLNTYGTKVD